MRFDSQKIDSICNYCKNIKPLSRDTSDGESRDLFCFQKESKNEPKSSLLLYINGNGATVLNGLKIWGLNQKLVKRYTNLSKKTEICANFTKNRKIIIKFCLTNTKPCVILKVQKFFREKRRNLQWRNSYQLF